MTSGPAIAELINHGQEVNRILAETVVQVKYDEYIQRRQRTSVFQLQTFTSSDYLLKNNCFDNYKLQNLKKKREKIFHSSDWSE